MLGCTSLKLKGRAKEWFTNPSAQAKPKTWDQVVYSFPWEIQWWGPSNYF